MKFQRGIYQTSIIALAILFGSLVWASRGQRLPSKPTKKIQSIPSSQLQRLDPHGDGQITIEDSLIESERSCQLCHSIKNGSRITEPLPIDFCFGCHNRSPHSGVVDHRHHDVTCLDCHEVHRSRSLLTRKSRNRWHRFDGTLNSSEWVVHSKPNAMIKKDCKDCHH